MRTEHECARCGFTSTKPQPFAICPACGYDGRVLTHFDEPRHDLEMDPEPPSGAEMED